MANCKHKNKVIRGKYHTDDNHKYFFELNLEDREYDELEIKDIVEDYIQETEEEDDKVIIRRVYSVVCEDCGKEIEIY